MIGSLFINKTYSRAEIKGLVEGILFVNGKAVKTEDLEKTLDFSKKDVVALIEEMNQDYTSRNSGFCIVPVGGGFQLFTHPNFKDELTELFGKRNENKIPKSSLETLAIIAYKQPVTKEDVDKIRGVSSTRSLNTLLALKLVNISGTSDTIDKSPLYSTTGRFLEFFRIKSMDDLPSLTSLEASDLADIADDEGDEEEEGDAGAETENKENTMFSDK